MEPEPPVLEIEVTQPDENKRELRATPIAHRGSTVIWTFRGKLAEQDLRVHKKKKDDKKEDDKDDIIFDTHPQSGQVSGTPFPVGGAETSFEYDIIDSEGNRFDWVGGRDGECIKHPVPPPGGGH